MDTTKSYCRTPLLTVFHFRRKIGTSYPRRHSCTEGTLPTEGNGRDEHGNKESVPPTQDNRGS